MNGKCRKLTSKNRNRKKCDLTLAGRIVRAGKVGANKFTYKGKDAVKKELDRVEVVTDLAYKPPTDQGEGLLFKIKGNLSLAALLNKGLVINIVCNEPCTIDGSLLIARNVAGRLHIVRSRQVKIASGHAKSKKGGKVKLRIKAKARAARGLRHTSRVKGILRITAKGKGGQKKHITKKVTLKK